MYTLAGFTVTTAEQARTILLMAMLKRNESVVKQALAVIKNLGG